MITEREYNQLNKSMDEIKTLMQKGFDQTNESIKSIEKDFNHHKVEVNQKLSERPTYKQVLGFGAWFVGTLLAIAAIIGSFLSITNNQ